MTAVQRIRSQSFYDHFWQSVVTVPVGIILEWYDFKNKSFNDFTLAVQYHKYNSLYFRRVNDTVKTLNQLAYVIFDVRVNANLKCKIYLIFVVISFSVASSEYQLPCI